MVDEEKTYISLKKYFLFLNYKLAKYEMKGINPPEHLLKKIEDTKRKLQIFDKKYKIQC